MRELLEKKQAQDTLVNLDRFYYAVLLDECDGNRREALNQLAVILIQNRKNLPFIFRPKATGNSLNREILVSRT